MRSYDTPPARKLLSLWLVLLFCAFAHAPASAQTVAASGEGQRRTEAAAPATPARREASAARLSETVCGGFI